MASWVCKVMFWYAAQAESIDEQFSNTQNTGEKFRMRCKCTEDAAPWVSFAKDEGYRACTDFFVDNGASAIKSQWKITCHTHQSSGHTFDHFPNRRTICQRTGELPNGPK